MLPSNAQDRKDTPIYSGVMKYFPDAIAYVARVSKAGNDQHNPGQPLHWDRSKSSDHLDCLIRHAMEADQVDSDCLLHAGKVAWRALAYLQELLEAKQQVASGPDVGDDGWIPVEPARPPAKYHDVLWNDGGISYGRHPEYDREWWGDLCNTNDASYITHWRPSKDL